MHPDTNSPLTALAAGAREAFLDERLSLRALELRIVRLRQKEQFRSAVGSRDSRQALLLRWRTAEGGWGIAECSGRPDPYYNEEFLDGSLQLLRDFIAPRLARSMQMRELAALLGRIRGWNFTKASVLDSAIDALRRAGVPDLLDRWQLPRLTRIPVGISLGIFPDSASAMQRVGLAREHGYWRIKLKLSPQSDPVVVRDALQAAQGRQPSLDANGSFGEDGIRALIHMMEAGAEMIEQPFAPDELLLHARLRAQLGGTRLCLDESVKGLAGLQSAMALGSLTELNLKPGRVGGQLPAVEMLEHCQAADLPCWIGGMFETGIGRLANLRHAACLPEATAHDLSPSSRYFERDIVMQPLEMDAEGMIAIGNGDPVELDEQAIEDMTEHKETLEPGG